MFAFVSNEKLNNSIENFNSTVNTAIDNSLDFVTDAQIVSQYNFMLYLTVISFVKQEADLTVERYNEIIAFVQCEINCKLIFSYSVDEGIFLKLGEGQR